MEDLTAQLTDATRLIDRWLAYKVYANRLPGLSVGLIYRDQVLLSKGYGYADLARKVVTQDTTCYRIASFSKIFTALAIMQLFEQGKLHLDDPVSRYLPWCVSESQPQIGHITIRQLLSHTSGLDRDGDTPHWNTFDFPSLVQIQQHIKEGALIFDPAEQWKYSNFGYTLLGEVVKAVAGSSYEHYVTTSIIKRLGLTHTAPELTNAITERLAVGYSRDLPGQGREPFPSIDARVMASATGFSSNVSDFCQFMMAHLDGDPRLLKDETKREMRRIQWLREGSNTDWCLGYETWKINTQRIYGHGGSYQGYRSRFGIDPQRGLGLVIFVNAMDASAKALADGAFHILDEVITHYDKYGTLATSLAPERYESYFRSIWGDLATSLINGGPVFYDPSLDTPSSDFSCLKHLQDDTFTIVSGDSFGNVGEPAHFEIDEQGLPLSFSVGPERSAHLTI
ncbi:serine hydrolase domain-containing protein [Ktedonospora formicarum]|uniref:Serine hydrolase n=1 Tax=Ktedonospora formicarum TaxID=2778364 RepID=A0A8J3MVI5_9CHLR|nr:serine hydrolase domain-containing protein [Ktedonospora formicarum]GHO46550.1 serine hydrolase [Ktedonospora formicarum]